MNEKRKKQHRSFKETPYLHPVFKLSWFVELDMRDMHFLRQIKKKKKASTLYTSDERNLAHPHKYRVRPFIIPVPSTSVSRATSSINFFFVKSYFRNQASTLCVPYTSLNPPFINLLVAQELTIYFSFFLLSFNNSRYKLLPACWRDATMTSVTIYCLSCGYFFYTLHKLCPSFFYRVGFFSSYAYSRFEFLLHVAKMSKEKTERNILEWKKSASDTAYREVMKF